MKNNVSSASCVIQHVRTLLLLQLCTPCNKEGVEPWEDTRAQEFRTKQKIGNNSKFVLEALVLFLFILLPIIVRFRYSMSLEP